MFWNLFPHNTTVKGPTTPVAVITLQHLIWETEAQWTASEKSVTAVLYKNLENGTITAVNKPLGEVYCKNSNFAIRNGKIMTDTIANLDYEEIRRRPV
jgi:hypothetical protein